MINFDMTLFTQPGPCLGLSQSSKQPSLREILDYYYRSHGYDNSKQLTDMYISALIKSEPYE